MTRSESLVLQSQGSPRVLRFIRVSRSSLKRCLLGALLVCASQAPAQERGANALGESVLGLGVNTRVLMIGAHPDDEDTNLIAWLSRGRHVETAYLSLTRGDGGQNVIGDELGELLGVIRTEELLAARPRWASWWRGSAPRRACS